MQNIQQPLQNKLESINRSDAFDPSEFKYIVSLLEENIPDELSGIFFDIDERKNKDFKKRLKQELLTADAECKIDDDLSSCIKFFELINLLKIGINKLEVLPNFIEDRDKHVEARMLNGKLNLDYESNQVDNFIEVALSYLGHSHDPETGIGGLDDKLANKIFQKLSCLWSSNNDPFDWLIIYLSFRFMSILINMDLFYTIHGHLAHYREFKTLTYLLRMLGRQRYQPISEFADVSHELFYSIFKDCKKVFEKETDIVKLQKSIAGTLDNTDKKVTQILKKIDLNNDIVSDLTLSIVSKFFPYYITELSEAGKFHIVLWTLPMFNEVKEAFQSIDHFGRKGFSTLVIGESGSGKESIAKLFLKSSGEQYVAINCAGLSWSDISKDLFNKNSEGEILANKIGAIFLDELDKAQLDAQGGLLRFLDKPHGEYRAPGEIKPISWSGLIIAAATERVYDKIHNGDFLPDLFWRFDVRANILPLRKLMSNPAIFDELFRLALRISKAKFAIRSEITLTEEQYSKLRGHSWLGNLREMLQVADSLAVSLIRLNEYDFSNRQIKIEMPMKCFEKVYSSFVYHADQLKSKNII